MGTSRMKALARSYLWWPKLDEDIEGITKNYRVCQEHQKNPGKAPLHPWEVPTKPSRLHIDYAGPFKGNMFLIVVDAYSKWLEVLLTTSANSATTIEKIRSVFATHGLPEMVVSDNATCFRSEEFGSFMRNNGIRHITSAPFHPATNGLAERNVQTVKTALKKLIEGNMKENSIQTLISRFVFNYRITPHTSTGLSPAEILMNRKLESCFT